MVPTKARSKPSTDFHEGRSRTPRGSDTFIVVLSAVVALIVTIFLFAPFRRSPPPSSRGLSTTTAQGPTAESPTAQNPTAQDARHTNGAAGYSFLHPAGWDVSDRGTVSELVGPDRDVNLSFGLGPEGDLREASSQFAASIAEAYDEVHLQGSRRESIAAHSAIVVGGTAVNQAGVGVRFLAISIGMDGRNYAISVFVADASDPVRVLPVVEDIISSFEVA